jgi:coenzyme F420-0:L-glutamate ligase/coenzyme F420-1:gamma-L-glutamate ligase
VSSSVAGGPPGEALEVLPVVGLPEIAAGDDLAAVLAPALARLPLKEGDVVVVTSKIVSKAEGRVIPGDDRAAAVGQETRRVVARRDDLVIAETEHGFVCANAGVDASNLDAGTLVLLPRRPDESAATLRRALRRRFGFEELGVILSDTFGRAWRTGVVNVAIGAAGLPSAIDLRGTLDDRGRELEATVVAFADELAAAAGLAMPKAGRVPVVVIRGAHPGRAPALDASALVRPASEDLFRESPMQALHARRTIRSFAAGAVPRRTLEEALRAACTAPAPHHSRPWRFSVLETHAARARLLGAMASAWRADLRADGVADDVIERRIARSDAVLGSAPVLVVPWIVSDAAHPYPDAERAEAERTMFLLSGGAAIQTLLLALHAHGSASCWISSTLFCPQETREALGAPSTWLPLGTIACGPMPEGGTPPPRPLLDLGELARFE